MKKVISILLCMQALLLPAYSQIEDNFVNTSLDKNLKVKAQRQLYIEDNLVNTTLDHNLRVRKTSVSYIDDSFAENNKNKNVPLKKATKLTEFMPTIDTKALSKPQRCANFDYSKNQDIRISIKDSLTTKNCDEEGSYVEFVTTDNNTINNKFFPKGTIVKARIENVSLNKSMGVPSELIIGNFSIKDIPLKGQIEKIGANRSLWLYPTVYVGSCFFGAGLLLMPIRGGHAKINSHEIFTVQFVPQI